MEIQQQKGVGNSKVVKVEKEESWDLFVNQASNEGHPVGFFFLALFFPHLFFFRRASPTSFLLCLS